MTRAEQVADAVLYEGYVLYPYRASAPKNRLRWQVGLVTPRDFSEAVASDPWFMQTECLVETGAAATLAIRVRGLHVQERAVEVRAPDDAGAWHGVERLSVDGRPLLAWDEAVACEFAREFRLGRSNEGWSWSWVLDTAEAIETVHDRRGTPAARIVRRRRRVVAQVRVTTETCGALLKVRVRVENVTPCAARSLAERDAAVRQSLAGTHVILALDGAAFVSLLEPAAEFQAQVAACANLHTFPVLVGSAGSRAVMLSSPIILYDYPAIAPESHGDLFDGTEIDELLTLRVRTLTDEEKQEARATDPRAAAIVDRCDAASPEAIGKLHGAVRSFESFLNPADAPPPEAASVDIAGVRVSCGSPVRLEPRRIADSMDICLRGRTGTVAAVYRTLEDEPYVAVTLHDDPFGVEGTKYRRSLFFRPEELVPLAGDVV